MPQTEMHYLFEPRSVAVIGVSHDPSKVGYKIVNSILAGGYKGKVFLVNPKGGKICGLPVYKSIAEIKEKIDFALISVPAKSVLEIVTECPTGKIKFLSIVSSGFSEAGNSEEEGKIVCLARKKGMRILGPNVFGLYSAKASLNATFGGKVTKAKAGSLAIISQSGALGIALMGKTETEKVGLSSIVFEGNKADLNEKDFLPYLASDRGTKAVFIYLEGVKDGKQLAENIKKTAAEKPVVILRAGSSAKGAEAAISHTGSLAGETKIFSAVMRQSGAVLAESLQQAINWSKFLASAPAPKGENTVIITNGGGIGILAADACEKYQVNLYEDKSCLKRIFSSVVPAFGSLKNPIDITGQATAQDYQKVLEKALFSHEIHAVICLGCETAVLDSRALSMVFRDSYKKFKEARKPIVFAFIGGQGVKKHLLSLKEKNVPIFNEGAEAVSCLAGLYRHYRQQKRKTEKPRTVFFNEAVTKKVEEIIKKARIEKRHLLYSSEAGEIAEMMGINLPESQVAFSKEEAVKAAGKVGFPVVMKIIDKDIVHKTEVGGVVLDLRNEQEVAEVYGQKRWGQVEIAAMIKGGIEMIVGAKKDRDFGTIVMAGLGGIYAEVLKDFTFKAFPISQNEAEKMLAELKSFPLLSGVRGEKERDIAKVAEIILKLGAVIENFPAIAEIEINPLAVFAKEEGAKALDVRVVINKG